MDEALIRERHDEVTTLTLNRPEKRNSLDTNLVELLLSSVVQASGDGTRLLVLRGNGKSFCGGFDLFDFDQQSEGDILLRLVRIEQLLQALFHAPFDTLALAHGANYGAGADLVCACHRRIATPSTTFQMPGLRFGVALGTRRLAVRVGGEAARNLLNETRTFGGAAAVGLGFLTGIAEKEEWNGAIVEAADSSRKLSPAAAADLHHLTVPDTRSDDMEHLVRSASAPGLKQRITKYRDCLLVPSPDQTRSCP